MENGIVETDERKRRGGRRALGFRDLTGVQEAIPPSLVAPQSDVSSGSRTKSGRGLTELDVSILPASLPNKLGALEERNDNVRALCQRPAVAQCASRLTLTF